MEPELKANLTSRTTWLRLVYMILFAIIFWISEFLIAGIAILQFLLKLFTGEVNPRLQTFGNSLGAYFHLMVAFLAFRTEEMPFPFAPWPDARAGDDGPVQSRSGYEVE